MIYHNITIIMKQILTCIIDRVSIGLFMRMILVLELSEIILFSIPSVL